MAAAADTKYGPGIVTVVAGSKIGYANGPGSEAKFSFPSAICCTSDNSNSLLVADSENMRVRRVFPGENGRTDVFAGSGKRDIKQGNILKASLYNVMSICADPLKSGCFYIGDSQTIRYCDGTTVTLIAGSSQRGFADGVGETAQFCGCYGLECTRDGQKIYVSDNSNRRIRAVDLKSRAVSTICGDGKNETRDGTGLNCSMGGVAGICFDRSPGVKPESALFVATDSSLRRFEITTQTLTTPPLKHRPSGFQPWAVECTSAGVLFVTCKGTNSLYAIYTSTWNMELITARLISPWGLAVKGQTAYIASFSTHQIVSVTLPKHLLVPSESPVAASALPVNPLTPAGSSGIRSGSGGSDPEFKVAEVRIRGLEQKLELARAEALAARSDLATFHASEQKIRTELTASHKKIADQTEQLTALQTKYQSMAITHASELKALRSKLESSAIEYQNKTKIMNDQITALASNLKGAEGLAASTKSAFSAGSSTERSPQSLSALEREVKDRPVNEWSAGAVIYWIERVFASEHKAAKVMELTGELRTAALGASAEVVTGQRLLSFKIRDFRTYKLADHLETFDLLMEAIDSLRDGVKTGVNIGSGGSGGGAIPVTVDVSNPSSVDPVLPP